MLFIRKGGVCFKNEMSRNRFYQKEIKDKQYLKVFNLSKLKGRIAQWTTSIDTIRVPHLTL